MNLSGPTYSCKELLSREFSKQLPVWDRDNTSFSHLLLFLQTQIDEIGFGGFISPAESDERSRDFDLLEGLEFDFERNKALSFLHHKINFRLVLGTPETQPR